MNKKKLGRILFLIPFIILGISIIFRILYNLQDLLSDFSIYLAIFSFFVSPLLLGFGLYFMIKYKEKGEPLNSIKRVYSNIKKWIKKHNTFFSKKVSIKNIILGSLIAIISLSALIFITFKIYEYILTERYSQIEKEFEDNKGLGEFSLPADSPFYADEYIDTSIDEREGYSKYPRHIDSPSYYFEDGEVVTLKDSWLLKNGYELDLVCEEVDLKKRLDPAEYLTCEIYYNGKLVVDNVYYNAYCRDFEDFTNCYGGVSFAVFSGPYSSPEFLATSYMPSGFDSSISVFNLENGKANRLSFETREGDVYESIGARVFQFELYEEYDPDNTSLQREVNTIELVNYQWNPGWLGEEIGGLYHIWEIEGNRFIESKSITIIHQEE